MKHALLVAGIVALLASAASAAYTADKIVPLPTPPNPTYTNLDSGTVTLTSSAPYIVEVQNTYNLLHWKEWYVKYQLTIIDLQLPWMADFHINYSHQTGDAPPIFEHDTIGVQEAYWQTYYAKDTSPQPLTWEAVGYPADPDKPIKVNPQAVNLVVDTRPFNYNPQWVSLEFAGTNVSVQYTFYDWCIPEPATLVMLGLGILALRKSRS